MDVKWVDKKMVKSCDVGIFKASKTLCQLIIIDVKPEIWPNVLSVYRIKAKTLFKIGCGDTWKNTKSSLKILSLTLLVVKLKLFRVESDDCYLNTFEYLKAKKKIVHLLNDF